MVSISEKNVMPSGNRYFTDEELDQAAKEIWPKLATYRAEDQSIASCDYKNLFKLMKWDRTDAQNAQYVVWIDSVWGGRITVPEWKKVMKTVHDRIPYFRWIAETIDKNGDGFISREEYDFGMDLFVAHEPTLAKITYDEVVEQADTNKDGQLSVDEMVEWLATVDNRVGSYRPQN